MIKKGENMAGLLLRKKVVYFGFDRYGSYLSARDQARSKDMELVGRASLDAFLSVRSTIRMRTTYSPFWVREFLVYPEQNGVFFKGRDIVDRDTYHPMVAWVLPARYIPEEAIGRHKVGLFVDPKEFESDADKIVLHPSSVTVLYPFIQKPYQEGLLSLGSRVPLDISGCYRQYHVGFFCDSITLSGPLGDADPRVFSADPGFLCRIPGVGVRPITHNPENPLAVHADYSASDTFRIMAEADLGLANSVLYTMQELFRPMYDW